MESRENIRWRNRCRPPQNLCRRLFPFIFRTSPLFPDSRHARVLAEKKLKHLQTRRPAGEKPLPTKVLLNPSRIFLGAERASLITTAMAGRIFFWLMETAKAMLRCTKTKAAGGL